MRIEEYEMPPPKAGTAVDEALDRMAHDAPRRLARLTTALREFLRADSHAPYRVLQNLEKRIDICIVPPRYVLMGVPDAALLVRVDHGAARIDILKVIDEYSGFRENAQWQQIVATASTAI